jgi:hypothetical protein
MPTMNTHLRPEEKLSILRGEDRLRRWNSLDDERLCVLCRRKFNGRQVEVRRFANGKNKLLCPTQGCASEPRQWVYLANPLIPDVVDPDWWIVSGDESQRLPGLSSPQFQRPKHA